MAGMVKPTREQIAVEVTKSPGFGHFENPGFLGIFCTRFTANITDLVWKGLQVRGQMLLRF